MSFRQFKNARWRDVHDLCNKYGNMWAAYKEEVTYAKMTTKKGGCICKD